MIAKLHRFRKMKSGIDKINGYGFINSAQNVKQNETMGLKRGRSKKLFAIGFVFRKLSFYAVKIHYIRVKVSSLNI